MTSQGNLQIRQYYLFWQIFEIRWEKMLNMGQKNSSKDSRSWSNILSLSWGCFIKKRWELYRSVIFEKSKPHNLKMTFSATSPNFGTQVLWLSLTFPWLFPFPELQGSHIFPKSKFRSLKEIQGKKLHNLKEILLMMFILLSLSWFYSTQFDALTYITVCRNLVRY